MISESSHITINLPVEQVFDFLSQDSNLSSWVNGVVSITPVGLPTGGVGDAVIIEVDRPQPMTIRSELIEYQPPHRLTIEHRAKGMTGRLTYQLSPFDGVTQLELQAQHQPLGTLNRLFAPVIGRIIKRERRKELARLKAVLEN